MSLETRLNAFVARVAQQFNTLDGGGAGFQRVLSGDAATGQNLFVNGRGTMTLSWANVSATSAVTFSNSNRVTFIQGGEARIHASIITTAGTVNNRCTYLPYLEHFDTNGNLKDQYYGPAIYLRDDNDGYDSGGTAIFCAFTVAAGDYFEIRSETVDESTTTGTQAPDPAHSLLKVDFQ